MLLAAQGVEGWAGRGFSARVAGNHLNNLNLWTVTLNVTVAEAERRFSQPKLVKTYLRPTMSQEHDDIIDDFVWRKAKKGPNLIVSFQCVVQSVGKLEIYRDATIRILGADQQKH